MIRNKTVGWAACVLILSLSLAPELLSWHAVVGSEDLSISTVVAVVAAICTALRCNDRRSWIVVASMIGLSVFARDTNTLLAVTTLLCLSALWVRRRRQRAAVHPQTRTTSVVVALICAMSIVVSLVIAQQADPPRWYFPTQENILRRVLVRTDYTKWFVQQGMPQVELLKKYSGSAYESGREKLVSDPQFAPFRRWLGADGQNTYLHFLVIHPRWSITEYFDQRDFVFDPKVSVYTRLSHAEPGSFYDGVGRIVFFHSSSAILLLSLLAFVVMVWSRLSRTHTIAVRATMIALIVTGLLHTLISYIGDDLEVSRHAITANVQVRLVLWICAALLADGALTRKSARTSPQS